MLQLGLVFALKTQGLANATQACAMRHLTWNALREASILVIEGLAGSCTTRHATNIDQVNIPLQVQRPFPYDSLEIRVMLGVFTLIPQSPGNSYW